MKLSPDDVGDLVKAVAWISHAETARFASRHPRASKWTEIWTELRQSYGPSFEPEARHRSAVVLCWGNRKTRKKKERILFVGSGLSPVGTASDLLAQLRAEIPAAFVSSPESAEMLEIVVRGRRGGYPVGLLGKCVVGRA